MASALTIKDSMQCFDSKKLSTGSLSSYIHWVNQIPLLTKDEEQALATEFHENGDLAAARKLVMSHLRFVVSVARSYNGYGLQQEDLIQEGNIGLMKAVKRFDPKVGVRLVSFAVHWVRAEIHEFVLKNWRIVKIATTKAQRKLFFNIRKAAKSRGWFSEQEINDVADALNVKPSDVRQMEMRLNGADQSFDALEMDEDNAWKAPAYQLEDYRFSPEAQAENDNFTAHQSEALHQALVKLDSRAQDIVQGRWLADKKHTLQFFADKYQISAERVRQLEQQAMLKLRGMMQ